MNGLTKDELKKLQEIKSTAITNLDLAQKIASVWMQQSPRRRALRLAACRSVKFLFSHWSKP